jgi:hypothetical protein
MSRPGLVPAALLWFGLLGAPLAWAGQLVVGYGVEEADCSAGSMRWGIESGTWELALTIATALVGALACAAAVLMLVRVRRREPDLQGRVEFMAAGGILVSAVFLVLIVLGGAAAVYLEPCTPG